MDEISELEESWYPTENESDPEAADAGRYFASRPWRSNEITSVPPMCYTDDPSGGFKHPTSNLQIVSIEVASIMGGLQWPIHVFGMVTARDVLENRKRIIIYARARSNCETITEEHPYLTLTGPTRAILTCQDPGSIEIVLKAKGTTESDDRDLSFLALTLQSRGFCSFNTEDYTSKNSTLKLGFHHIDPAVEATISVRLSGGILSLPPGCFQGAFTASTASIADAQVLLLAFRDGELPVADDGTVNLSRRVVSVGYTRNFGYTRNNQKDQLKVSMVARSAEEEQNNNATIDDIVFTPKTHGRSHGVFNLGACKLKVTVAWSMFDY